ERGRQLGGIDHELQRRVDILANVFRRPPRGPGQGFGQGFGPGQGRGQGQGPGRGQDQGRPPLDRFQPGQQADNNDNNQPQRAEGSFQPQPDSFVPGPNDPRPQFQFHLPQEAEHLFDTNDPNGFYFVIGSRDGKEIARSPNVPSHIF